MRFGRPDSVIFKNNLIIDMGILGDATQGDRSKFVEPLYFIDLDSVYTDTTNTTLKVPYIDWRSNYFYFNPEVAALLPDSANPAYESLFTPNLEDIIGESKIHIMLEKFPFANFPATIAEYKAHIDDFYNQAETRANLPQFDTPWNELDFSYSTSLPAYSAATDGGPIGDRNWFPNYVSTGVKKLADDGLMIYPNPASNVLNVNLGKNRTVSTIALFDIVGKEVKNISVSGESNFSISLSYLRSGLYFVKFFDHNGPVSTKKLVIRQ